eukprot:406927_1
MGAVTSKQSKSIQEPLFVKPSIPKLTFGEHYTVSYHEIALGNQTYQQRIYLLFDPHSQSSTSNNHDKHEDEKENHMNKDGPYSGVVFLFHGTNEMCYDTELIEQLQSNYPKYTWMDIAMKHNLLKEDHFKSVWSPDNNMDKQFVYKLKTHVFNKFVIKENKSYAIGYSNGGIFLCNLLLDNPHLFDVNVSWGGGIETSNLKTYHLSCEELDKQLKNELKSMNTQQNARCSVGKWSFYVVKLAVKKADDDMRRGRIVIMTGSRDDNRTPSYRAWLAFQNMRNIFEVRFEDWKDSKHQYRSDATKHIWDCFTSFYEFKSLKTNELYTVYDE